MKRRILGTKGLIVAPLGLGCMGVSEFYGELNDGVLAQGEDVVPIPGTKRRYTLDQNLDTLKLELTKEAIAQLDALLPKGAAAGRRYPEAMLKRVGRLGPNLGH